MSQIRALTGVAPEGRLLAMSSPAGDGRACSSYRAMMPSQGPHPHDRTQHCGLLEALTLGAVDLEWWA